MPPLVRRVRRGLRLAKTAVRWPRAMVGRRHVSMPLRGNTDSVLRWHLVQTVAALTEAGLDPFVVPTASAQRPRVGVTSSPAAVIQALRAHPVTRSLLLKAPGVPAVRISAVPEGYVRGVQSLVVFARHTVNQLVLDHSYGCDVEFWFVNRRGVREAPRPNAVAAQVPPALTAPMDLDVLGEPFPSLAGFVVRDHVDKVDFDVDLVYTWVDGSDPAWLDRYRTARARVSRPDWHAHAANASRYVDREELRYSLRSLWMYADVFRHIYIVTDRQVPQWLRTDHPKISVVDHSEIFSDHSVLPTFNSHAIESRLHHIEGLSEHFVYANDDMFFGQRTTPLTFFASNGLSRFVPGPGRLSDDPPGADDNPAEVAAKNNRELLRDRLGTSPPANKIRHIPYALRRSVLLEMESEFAEDFQRTARSTFRDSHDVSVASNFFHYYAYLTRRAVPADATFRYLDISGDRPMGVRAALRTIRRQPPTFFCINDVDGNVTANVERAVQDFFESMYPLTSPFEL